MLRRFLKGVQKVVKDVLDASVEVALVKKELLTELIASVGDGVKCINKDLRENPEIMIGFGSGIVCLGTGVVCVGVRLLKE